MDGGNIHARLLREIERVVEREARINDAGTCGTEEVRLILETPAGERMMLRLLLLASPPLFWLEATGRQRPMPSSGFADWLRLRSQGARIAAVTGGTSGRILRLALTGTTEPCDLVLDPLTNGARLLVLNPAGVVEQRYPPPVHQRPTGRGAPGHAYAEPSGTYQEPWQKAGGLIAPGEDERLWVCRSQNPPGPPFLSPIALSTEQIEILQGPDPIEIAPRTAGRLCIARERETDALRRVTQMLRRERRHLAKLAEHLATEIDQAREGPLLRRQAEALLSSGMRIPRGTGLVELEDPAAPGERLQIELDPARGFAENATRLFKRAGRMERALAVRLEKGAQIGRLLARLEQWSASLPALPDVVAEGPVSLEPGLARRWHHLLGELAAARARLTQPLERVGHAARRTRTGDGERAAPDPGVARGPTEAAAERLGLHPRHYRLTDGWIVLVGRTNRENDLLTHRAARPRDLWFHARGVAGSHVVLQRGQRKDNPSKAALETAASIAAYHSKARTSATVPVIYTEKRYVRKPRKSAPGLAACIREKVLMVTPQLPPQAVT